MNTFFFSLLLGGAQGTASEGGPGGFITTIAPFVLLIGIFYFLIIRPQNKKQKETQKMLESLKKGDRIVTIGGIHGVIQTVKESTVTVKIDENTKVEFSRSAISTVTNAAKADKSERIEEKKEESSPAADKGEESNDTKDA